MLRSLTAALLTTIALAIGCSGVGNLPFKDLQKAFADLIVIEPAT